MRIFFVFLSSLILFKNCLFAIYSQKDPLVNKPFINFENFFPNLKFPFYDSNVNKDALTVDEDIEISDNGLSEDNDLDHISNEDNTYPVVLQPLRRIQLYAEIYSPINQINYRMGDSFKKGEILISLKNDKYVSQYEKAVSFLDKANSELEATQDLYNDFIASFFELKEAQSKVAEAKANLAIAKDELDATIIRAPFDGKVVSIFAEEKEMPPSNKQLIEIIDDHILTAKLLFPIEDLDKIHIGSPIKIKINHKIVIGKITRIGALIDPSSSTIKVEAEVNNKDGKLKAGTIGTASI